MTVHRVIKFVLLVTGLVCVLVLAALLLLPAYYQERAPALVREKLAKQSNLALAPFQMEISGWKHFPYLTFSLSNLALTDTSNSMPLQVLGIRYAEVQVPLTQWPSGTLEVEKVFLEGVSFHQRVDSTGKKTTLSFHHQEGPKDAPGEKTLHIRRIRVRNARFLSENDYKKGAFSLDLIDSDLAATVSNHTLNLKGSLKGKVNYIASRELRLFQGRDFTADASYTFNFKNKQGRLQNTRAVMNGNDVLISGTHRKTAAGPGSVLDLHFEGYQPFFFLLNQMSSVRSIPLLKKVQSEGRVKLHYHIAGYTSPIKRPRNRLYFALQDGRLFWPTSRIALSHIQIKGELDNGPEHSPKSSTFTLHNFSARTGQDSVQLQAKISNFNHPFVDARISGRYTLDSLAEVLPTTYVSGPRGTIAGEVTIRGNLHADKLRDRKQDLQWQGAVRLQNVAFQPAKLHVACTNLNGKAKLAGNELRLQHLTGKLGGQPFSMQGSVKDVVNYLLGQRPTVALQGDVRMQQVNTGWLALEPETSSTHAHTTAAKAGKEATTILPAFLRVNVGLHCRQLIAPAGTVQKLHARLQSNGKWLTVSDIALTAHNVDVKGKAAVPNDSRRFGGANLQLTAELDTLDLTTLEQVRAAMYPGGKKKPGTSDQSMDWKDLMALEKAQLLVQVNRVLLPGDEDMQHLTLQLNKNREQITMRKMRFETTKGGVATANGGFRFVRSMVTAPYLDVALQYNFLDLQAFMQNIAALKVLLPPEDSASVENAPAAVAGKQSRFKEQFKEQPYNLHLQVKAQELQYEYLCGTNLAVDARMNRQRAHLDKLYLNAFGGVIYSNGVMYLDEPTDTVPVKLRAQAQDVDLKQVFAFAEQMELDVLSSQNIKGTADCNMAVSLKLDQTYTPSFDRTVAYTSATFKNMELIDVKPIQEALGFINKERTGHLYFEDVKADFVLYRNKFVAPGFSLNNNLSSFNLRGSYTMNGNASLSMDINVLNILFGNNERRIEKIQQDSLELNDSRRKQHLLLVREQDKYKVKLSNRKERETISDTLRSEFLHVLERYQIDTAFTVVE